MEKKTYDLREALRAGADPEKMIEDFATQLAQAKCEIEAEKAAVNLDLDESRANVVQAIIEYIVALGVAPASMLNDTDFKDSIVEALEEAEEEVVRIKPFLDLVFDLKKDTKEENKKERSADEIIENFLKTIL